MHYTALIYGDHEASRTQNVFIGKEQNY